MIREKAFAKLNLNLHVLPKRLGNGYYSTHFINCQIGLHDELTFMPERRSIRVMCDDPLLVHWKENWVYQMAVRLRNAIGNESLGATISLRKNIPITAGYGGGSSDAAATARGLLSLWKVSIDQKRLEELVASFGKDAAYSLEGGLCEMTTDPDAIVSLNAQLPTFWLVIVVPASTKPSTSWMYEHIDVHSIGKHADVTTKLKEAIKEKDSTAILENLHNDFWPMVGKAFPEVSTVEKEIRSVGAAQTLLAGSGLSMAGFFLSEGAAQEAHAKLSKKNRQVFLTTTLS